ncbi:MAG: hypothetical protein IJ814_05520 [Paludibacteraceae bacterium]|nr:hypothetical protein [Paludibacteraceae bacterium]
MKNWLTILAVLLLSLSMHAELRQETLTMYGIDVQYGSSSWQISGCTPDSATYITLIFFTDRTSGHFTAEDFFPWGTYVLYMEGEEMIFYDMTEADINVANEANNVTVTGTMLTRNEANPTDSILFTLLLTASAQPAIPLPSAFLASDLGLDIYPSAWQLGGMNDEGNAYINLYVNAAEVAGVYTAADLHYGKTYLSSLDREGEVHYFAMIDAALTAVYLHDTVVVAGTMTVVSEEDESDVRTVALELVGSYLAPEERHYSYDTEDADFIVNFAEYTVDSDYLLSDGLLYIDASDNQSGAVISLEVHPQTDATTLVPGNYPIDGSRIPGTVTAGRGLNAYGALTYSYAMYDGRGTQPLALWSIVSGTVTVQESGAVAVEARNSFNRIIRCRLGTAETPESIGNIDAGATATKRLENGTLVIEKNGIRYNVTGSVIR